MSHMPITSECLKRLVPSFSLSMIRVDERCAPTQLYSEYFDEFSHRLFAASGHHFAASADDPAAFGNLLRGRRRYGTLIDNPPAYLAGGTYQHLFARNGIHHCLDVSIRSAEGPLGILGIFRDRRARPFTRADLLEVHQFYPFLEHAFSARPLSTQFDEVGSGLIVASAEGVIRWASSTARAWIADGTTGTERALLLERNLLPEACRRLCRSLDRSRRSLVPDAAELQPPTLSLAVTGGRLRLRAYSMDAPGSDSSSRSVGIQLTLEMDRAVRILRALEVSSLGPQLRRLAFELWRRKRPAQIAAELNLTASSLKSYRRELYARLGVNSAEELLRHLDQQADAVTFDLRRHLPRPSDLP